MSNLPAPAVDVADVRHRHPIQDVVAAEGIDLRRAGKGWMGCCPFHDDATASLSVGGVPERFHCFGCQASGDVIDFIGRLHGLGFREAVAHLDGPQRALNDHRQAPALAGSHPEPRQLADIPTDRAHAVNLLAWAWFSRPVAHEHALAYLRHHRHIDLREAEHQSSTTFVGHSGHGWTSLVDHLRSRGVTDEELLDLDLAQTCSRGTLIDTLIDRIIIPVTDPDGAITGFVGRDTSGHPRAPKYRNPTHTPVFDKSTCLYSPTRKITPDTTVVIVEGALDALAITAAAAASGALERVLPASALGTTVSAVQARRVIGLSAQAPVIALDGDNAGRNGTLRWVEAICRQAGQLTLVTDLPAGADPADWLARHGTDGLAGLSPSHTLPAAAEMSLRTVTPHLPGREIAELACQDAHPIEAAVRDLTRIGRGLSDLARRSLSEHASIEMARQGWNPNDTFTRQLSAALDRPAPETDRGPISLPFIHQL